jgi:hypothetical protein
MSSNFFYMHAHFDEKDSESHSAILCGRDIEALAFIAKNNESSQVQSKAAERQAEARVPRATLSQELIKQMQHMVFYSIMHNLVDILKKLFFILAVVCSDRTRPCQYCSC